MSVNGVEKFLELAKTDEKFKQNIIKTIKALQIKEGKSFNEDQLIENVIIPLAQKRGINFTEKDFLNYADKKTSKLHEEDLPMVSGGIDKTSKAKLLLGVTLLGTSTAAAMNLAQLRHEKPASSIKETSQNESSENNPHSSQNKTILQSNHPKTEGIDKRIGEEHSRAKLEKELEKNSIENLSESANNINDADTTGQNINSVVTSKKHIESLQRKEVVLPNINAKSTSEISQINVTPSHTDIAKTSTDDSMLTVSGALNLETGTVNVGSNNATSNKSKSPATKLADTSLAPAPVPSQLAPKTEENTKATAKRTNEYADSDIKKNVHPTADANLIAAKVEPKNDAVPIASTLIDIGAADKTEMNNAGPKDTVSKTDPAPPDTAVSEVSDSTADKKPDTDVIELKDDNIGTTVSATSEVTVWQTLKNTGKNVVNLASYLNPLNIFKGKSSSNFDLTSS